MWSRICSSSKHKKILIVNQPFFKNNTLQVRKALGPTLGFWGSLDLNSLQEIIGIHVSFRWGSISILDHSAGALALRSREDCSFVWLTIFLWDIFNINFHILFYLTCFFLVTLLILRNTPWERAPVSLFSRVVCSGLELANKTVSLGGEELRWASHESSWLSNHLAVS